MRTSAAFPSASKVAILTLVSLFLLGISASSAQQIGAAAPNNRKWNYDELTRVPEMAREKPNPLENDSDSRLAGGKLFERHCASCHGMKAEGGKRGPSLLRDEVQQSTPGALFSILTNGVVRHGMPVWSKLPDPQRWQIVSFLKSLKTPPGPQKTRGSE
jgi:mono/diheme cytochrome c family protein